MKIRKNDLRKARKNLRLEKSLSSELCSINEIAKLCDSEVLVKNIKMTYAQPSQNDNIFLHGVNWLTPKTIFESISRTNFGPEWTRC